MREDLESRLLKEAALREVEKRRMRELEEVKKELQRLLEEERQAKRDEEIVRQLQARYEIIHHKKLMILANDWEDMRIYNYMRLRVLQNQSYHSIMRFNAYLCVI